MKHLSFIAIMLSGIFTTSTGFAQKSLTNDTIKVWGNCGMCKTTIEKSAKAAGAKTAEWSEDTKQLVVSYAANKTTTDKIQQAVANAGYDTRDYTAPVEVYKKLHGCCQYERKSADVAAGACCSNATCGTPGDNCKAQGCCKDAACNKKM